MPSPARRPTRRDVARLAGVSDAVVSYTLNGGAPVAPATAERVRDAVQQLGYAPNAAARALNLGSSRLLGIIVPDTTNPFWAELCREVEQVARKAGYAVLVVDGGTSGIGPVAYFQLLAARQVDGILVAGGTTAADAAAFDATGVTWALLNPSGPGSSTPGAGMDLRGGGALATAHLLDHGRTRIAFVGPDDDDRRTGWQAAHADAGREPGPGFPSGFGRDDGLAAGRRIATRNDVDAVFACSDLVAVGVLRALHEAGVAVPEEIAVIGFDGSTDSAYTWPTLTTVRQPVRDLAAHAVGLLLGSPRKEPGPAGMTGDLVLRASCGCPVP